MQWVAEAKNKWWGMIILTAIGFIIALVAYYEHVSAGDSWCNINSTINCDLVNKSPYAEFYGVPVAAIGMLGYVVIFLLVYELRRRPKMLLYWLLWLVIIGAILASLVLAGVSGLLIGAWCLVCLASYLITLLILANMISITRHKRRHERAQNQQL